MSMRLSRSIVGEAEAEAVRRVIVEDGYLGMGHETCLFEQELAAYLGVAPEQVVTTNTGTAALTLAVDAIAPRDTARKPQILVPSLTFVASFQAIEAAGCEPVACDVLAETGTIDLKDAARRITPDTLAIMPVHYASNPWHLDEVHAFAREHGLRVIEDAAHAFGCLHHGRKIGSFGDVVCFSFDGIKNITSGEGGCAVFFNATEAGYAADARLLSVEGDTRSRFAGTRTWDPDVKRIGWRFHMSNIMAAIGRVQLSRLDGEFIPARRALGEDTPLTVKMRIGWDAEHLTGVEVAKQCEACAFCRPTRRTSWCRTSSACACSTAARMSSRPPSPPRASLWVSTTSPTIC